MIKELFLCAALSLPASNFSTRDFVQEYRWLLALLKETYPKSEFLIKPKEFHLTPKGYDYVPLRWRGHSIYRRNA
jgi:hypothetical protein